MRASVLFSAAFALALPTAVSAQEAPTSIVRHADLDLTTKDGISRLDERLNAEIRRMCRGDGRTREDIKLQKRCRKTALASATPAIRLAIATANFEKVDLASAKPVASEG